LQVLKGNYNTCESWACLGEHESSKWIFLSFAKCC